MKTKSQKVYDLLSKEGPLSKNEIIQKIEDIDENFGFLSYACRNKNITSFDPISSGSPNVTFKSNPNIIYYIFNEHTKSQIIKKFLDENEYLVKDSENKGLRHLLLQSTSKSEKDEVRKVLDEKGLDKSEGGHYE